MEQKKHALIIRVTPSNDVLIVFAMEELSFQSFLSTLISQREMSLAEILELSPCD